MRIRFTALLAVALTWSMIACNSYPVTGEFAGGQGDTNQFSIEGSWSAGDSDPGVYGNSRGVLHNWLVAESANAGITNPVEVRVTDAEMAEIDNAQDTGRLAVGIDKTANAAVSFSNLRPEQNRDSTQALSYGSVRFDGNEYIWTATVKSAGATAMRLHFANFNLPRYAELYVYNQAGEVFGPYTGNGPLGTGEFWSHTVSGELVLVQLHHSGSSAELRSAGFVIQDVGHLGPNFLIPGRLQNQSAKTLCGYNEPCVENAKCYSNSAIDNAKNAVAHIVFLSGHTWYICTGGLLADTDPASEIPYFLTANHCFSRAKSAASLEAYFFYQTADCPDDCTLDPYGLPRTLGSTIKRTNRTGDYVLVELSQPAPAGAYFLGWNADDIAFADGTRLYRVSHPKGAPLAYSEHVVETTFGDCGSWPMGSWIYSQDVLGATEGGSSGSPVLNEAGQVVGQLSGGCGTNVSEVCDTVNNRTVDGAFASYFTEVQDLLDPVVCIPVAEVCDDGTDNDCDGQVDCGDSDCSGDPGCASNCAPAGGYCDSNSDCCSNRCNRKKHICK